MTQKELISELKVQLKKQINVANFHLQKGELLKKRPGPKKWNTLECYEHMNLYGDLYLGYFEEAISNGKPRKTSLKHKSGWLGGYSARSMKPKEIGVNSPMKTFKKMDPFDTDLENLVIDRFIKQQQKLLLLLDKTEHINIDSVRCRTTLKFLKFKLSDTLKFFINHNDRHIVQAERAMQ